MIPGEPTSWIGRQIDTRYVIESELGGGGMGVVLRGRHRFTGAAVAIKMMRADLQVDAGLQERFLAEARAPALIGHPGIVNVFDAGKMQSGELYLVMELLEGDPLRTFVINKQLKRPEIRRIGTELLDALGAAHARGFVHRDLKPENIFLEGPTRVMRLLDFGIAKTLAPDLASPKTAAGVVLGTLLYMSPEQLRDPRSVDGRSDLWSVGVILYELLSGALPYRGSTGAELYTALATKEPEPIARALPGVGPEISAFFARALSRDPTGRFATAAEMAAALTALPLDATPTTVPVSPTIGVATQWTLAGADPALAPVGVVAVTVPPTMASKVAAGPPFATPAPVAAPPRPITGPVATPAPVAPVRAPTASMVPPTEVMNVIGRSNRKYFALVLALIAAGMIVAGVVVATRGGTTPELATAPTPPVAKPKSHLEVIDVPVGSGEVIKPVTPPPTTPTTLPATPTKPPTTTPTKPPPPTTPPALTPNPPIIAPTPPTTPTPPPATPTKPPAAAFHEACAAGCSVAAQCGIIAAASCQPGCERAENNLECFRNAKNCNDAASCSFQHNCKTAPVGAASCNQTMNCQNSCRGDIACGCACVQPMAPSHTYTLWLLDKCAQPCGSDVSCITAKCVTFINGCGAQ